MTKLEELKAAYEAAELGDSDLDEMLTPVAQFVAITHNLMPQLLDAVELLKAAATIIEGEYPESDDRRKVAVKAIALLEKLK